MAPRTEDLTGVEPYLTHKAGNSSCLGCSSDFTIWGGFLSCFSFHISKMGQTVVFLNFPGLQERLVWLIIGELLTAHDV